MCLNVFSSRMEYFNMEQTVAEKALITKAGPRQEKVRGGTQTLLELLITKFVM